jgi:diguanylate cyclase (GGDEF)-like protein/PAS domain S-box-containing protein
MKRPISLIRLTIIIAITGITVIGSLIAYITFNRGREYTLLQSFDHMSTIMDLVSQNVRSIIDERIKLLSLLREELIRRDISPSLINLLLEEFDTVLYIDRNGNIVRYWSRVEKIDRVNVSHREYFIRTKATLKPYLGNSFKNIAGNYGVPLTVPIINNGSFDGLLVGGILLGTQKINYLVSSASFHRTGSIKILDERGIVLFSSDPTEIGKIFDKFPLDGGYKSIRIERNDGKDYIVGISTLPDTNWKLLATVEKEDILTYSYRNLRYVTTISIFLILILILVIAFPLKRLLSSLDLLAKTASEYVLGYPAQSDTISNFKEINYILRALREMRNIIREREERLKEEQVYLENLLLEMGEGVLVLDSNKKIKFVNRSLLEMLGYSERDISKIDPLEIFIPSEREKIIESLEGTSKDERFRGRISVISKDGRIIPVLCSMRLLRVDEKETNYLLVFTDLTEIAKREKELEDALEEIKTLNEELNKRSQQLEIALASLDMKLFETARAKEEAERLAITDPLTGLFNRRFLEEKLSNELIRAKAHNNYLSIVMADIDHFKRINDAYGHKVGDEVLKALALILRANTRENDTVARYGGEEFVILLSNVSKYDAYRIAERIRLEIEDTSFEEIGVPEKITVSFGISCFPEDGEDAIDLLKKADQALYQAKSQGRNRVVVFTEPSESIHF